MVLELITQYIDVSEIQGFFSSFNIFLIILALVWLVIAVVQDFRKREVANWWNFSLIAFVLAFRAFESVQLGNYWYFLWGLIGLGLGFLLANGLYYARMFAGGDAKLILALGTVIPLSLDWKINLFFFIGFLIFFILAGSIYGFVYSIILCLLHRKEFSKEFVKQVKLNKRMFFGIMIFSLLIGIVGLLFNFYIIFILAIVLFFSPPLLAYAKAIEESCMIKQIKIKDLTVGDWTVSSIKAGRKVINPDWEGLNEEDIKLIKSKLNNNKKINVKEGIPFTPSFLFGFLILIFLLYKII